MGQDCKYTSTVYVTRGLREDQAYKMIRKHDLLRIVLMSSGDVVEHWSSSNIYENGLSKEVSPNYLKEGSFMYCGVAR